MPASVQRFIPALFVFLWSTGFIVARYAMPYAEPMTFMFLRFCGVLLVMLPVVLLWPPRWPSRVQIAHIAIAGMLLQTLYLGGVWAAIKMGMSASLVALIMGLQPLITACMAALLTERVSGKQWGGLLLGLCGVALVVQDTFTLSGMTQTSLLLALLALLSITVGTVYQKRFCPSFDLRAGSVIQFSAAALFCLPFMFLFETREIDWQMPLIASLLWSIFALSIGAISLLFIMIRDGAATKVTSYLYMTPAITALMAWLLFAELITPLTIAGTALTVFALILVSSPAARVRQ